MTNYCVVRCKYDPNIHEYIPQCVEKWDMLQDNARSLANVLNRHTLSSHYLYKAVYQHSTDSFLLSDYDVVFMESL